MGNQKDHDKERPPLNTAIYPPRMKVARKTADSSEAAKPATADQPRPPDLNEPGSVYDHRTTARQPRYSRPPAPGPASGDPTE
ncbi:hypothetical protein RGQ15_11225 [Paracoccus sp. MBLB3053]|uniref:Uncharacterized protein n=1 Tax=Paracoccus aurantius TaxID=3073814 RepID=A0ABU2HTS0_9RHOB|nr:hypothetical protein [Paracoccus sp. MBLB3053]MDS9468137.1 hypothetical protein [Paracoccus sp. MBLB3053]